MLRTGNPIHRLQRDDFGEGGKGIFLESWKGFAAKAARNFSASKIILPKESVLRDRIEHWAFFCERRDKIDFLRRLVFALKEGRKDAKGGGNERLCPKILVFTNRADQVENIASKLKYKGMNCALLHARTKNQERQTMLAHFKNGKTPILVTSDLSSRGLDIPDIEYVVQTDLPGDGDFFVHRAGRTARAGKRGVNIVIGDAYELRNLAALKRNSESRCIRKNCAAEKSRRFNVRY